MANRSAEEMARRAELAAKIRKIGNGHREPVALYRKHDDTEPVATGIVSAIETDAVVIAGGTRVPWLGLERVGSVPSERFPGSQWLETVADTIRDRTGAELDEIDERLRKLDAERDLWEPMAKLVDELQAEIGLEDADWR